MVLSASPFVKCVHNIHEYVNEKQLSINMSYTTHFGWMGHNETTNFSRYFFKYESITLEIVTKNIDFNPWELWDIILSRTLGILKCSPALKIAVQNNNKTLRVQPIWLHVIELLIYAGNEQSYIYTHVQQQQNRLTLSVSILDYGKPTVQVEWRTFVCNTQNTIGERCWPRIYI